MIILFKYIVLYIQSQIIGFLVEIFSQEFHWVIGYNIRHLQEPLIQDGYHKLHQIIPKGHLLNLLLALLLDIPPNLLPNLLPILPHLISNLFLRRYFLLLFFSPFLIQTAIVSFVLVEELLFSDEIIIGSAVLNYSQYLLFRCSFGGIRR